MFHIPVKKETIPFHIPEKNALIAPQIAFQSACRAPNPIVRTVDIVFHACCKKATIISHIPENICLIASHAPDQFPVNTELIKFASPFITSRNPFINCPQLSHSPLNHASIVEPHAFQNVWIHPNTVSITVAIALNTALPASYKASQTADKASRIACHTAKSLSFVLVVEPSMLSSVPPNIVAASWEINVHTPLRNVFMIPQTLMKLAFILSPCLSKNPLTVSTHIPAACLRKSHTLSRNSLTFCHALKIASLALSAPIPALSNIVPITESFPMRKFIKSSTISANSTTAATIAKVFKFAKLNKPFIFVSNVINAFAPDMILLQFITIKKAPAIIAKSFRALSTPPSLSITFFTIPMPFFAPICKVCIIRSIAGFNLFTKACIPLNALVRIPVSDVSFFIPTVAFDTKELSSFNTITAGFKNAFPAAAFKSCTFCFKLPS